jgi:hypothetical protein
VSRPLQHSTQAFGGAVAFGGRAHQCVTCGRDLAEPGDVLTIREAADYLHFRGARRYVSAWRWIKRNDVPVQRRGRSVFVRRHDLDMQLRDDNAAARRRKVATHA